MGLFLLVKSTANSVEVIPTSDQAQAVELGSLSVDVSGAVQLPGIYQLGLDARVGDALALAGGLAESADHELIAKNLNLAEKIEDGQKIFVPFEFFDAPVGSEPQSIVTSKKDDAPDFNGVSFNSATAKELESLPGIGQKKANDVIEARPFSSLDEVKELIKVSDEVWTEILKLANL